MPPFLRPIRFSIVALGLCAGASAWAQPAPSPQAEALFAAGRAALQKGDYQAACSRFTESFDRSGSLGPLLNLAECEERRGHLAAALARWKQGVIRLESLPLDERMALARGRIAALEKRLPRLTIKLADHAASGIVVRLDEQPIATLPAVALPVDPGEHRLSISAPDHAEQRITVTLAEAEKKDIEVGAFAKADVAAPPSSSSSPLSSPPPRDSKRTVGFVVGGIGVAGLAAFGITGGLMFGQRSIVREHCTEATKTCNDAVGLDAAATGRTLGVANAIALGVGVAGIGVGAVLVLTSGGKSGPETAVSSALLPGGAGLSLRHTF